MDQRHLNADIATKVENGECLTVKNLAQADDLSAEMVHTTLHRI
jgi:hypothetical protein